MRLRTLYVSLFFLLPVMASASLSVRFDGDTMVVSGATRGGKVVCSWVERLPPRLLTSGSVVLSDDDRDGEVHFAVPNGVGDRAVFTAVDFASGEYVVVNSAGPLSSIDFHGNSLK